MHCAFRRETLQANRWSSENEFRIAEEPHLMRRFLLGFLAGILAFPVVVLLVAGVGLLPINANTSPTGLGRRALTYGHQRLGQAAVT